MEVAAGECAPLCVCACVLNAICFPLDTLCSSPPPPPSPPTATATTARGPSGETQAATVLLPAVLPLDAGEPKEPLERQKKGKKKEEKSPNGVIIRSDSRIFLIMGKHPLFFSLLCLLLLSPGGWRRQQSFSFHPLSIKALSSPLLFSSALLLSASLLSSPVLSSSQCWHGRCERPLFSSPIEWQTEWRPLMPPSEQSSIKTPGEQTASLSQITRLGGGQ